MVVQSLLEPDSHSDSTTIPTARAAKRSARMVYTVPYTTALHIISGLARAMSLGIHRHSTAGLSSSSMRAEGHR
jgi:hypothetical protein